MQLLFVCYLNEKNIVFPIFLRLKIWFELLEQAFKFICLERLFLFSA